MMKKERKVFTQEFKSEAVRLVETSGLTIQQVAEDSGVGLSTLTRWLRIHRNQELLSAPHDDVNKELARLRKENQILRAERDLLKKGTAFCLVSASVVTTPGKRVLYPSDSWMIGCI